MPKKNDAGKDFPAADIRTAVKAAFFTAVPSGKRAWQADIIFFNTLN